MPARTFVDKGLLAALLLLAAALPFSIGVSQMALGLAVFFWLLKLILDYRSELLVTPISVVFLIWVAVGLLAALFATRPAVSLPALKEEWLFLGFFVAWGGISTLKQWRSIVLLLAVAATLGSLYAVWQHFTGLDLVHRHMLTEMVSGFRAQGTLNNYLTFGGMFALLGLFLLPLAGVETGKRRYFLLAAATLTLLGSALSYTRSSLLAIIVGVFLFVVLLVRRYGRQVLLVPGLLLLLLIVTQRDVLYRFIRENPQSNPRSSILNPRGERWEIWATALNMYEAHPILGVGQDNFLSEYEKYAPAGARERFAGAHNDLLMMAATKGTIGALAYIVIWAVLARQLWRSYWRGVSPILAIVAATGLVIIAGYLVMSQFEAYFCDEEVKLAVLFLLGMVFSRMNLRA